jgi:hypothetical protein
MEAGTEKRQEIYDYWREKEKEIGSKMKPAKISKGRAALIDKALQKHTVSELKSYLDWCYKRSSQWCDFMLSKGYHDIENWMRQKNVAEKLPIALSGKMLDRYDRELYKYEYSRAIPAGAKLVKIQGRDGYWKPDGTFQPVVLTDGTNF